MSDTFQLTKKEILRKEKAKLEATVHDTEWCVKQKVALTCRILSQHGHDSGLAGQITALEQDGAIVTQPFGIGFSEITKSNLLTVDEDLNVFDGKGIPNPANRFHSWIYKKRPDVRCIIHTHPLYTSALSMLKQPLKIAHMDSCILFDDVAFLDSWPGVPVGNDVGQLISTVLEDKRSILLAHHGLLVACTSIEEACVVALQFERAAKLQILASSVAEIQEIPGELAQESRDWLLKRERSILTFSYHARQVVGQDATCLI